MSGRSPPRSRRPRHVHRRAAASPPSRLIAGLLLLGLLGASATAPARIKLITLPERERVEIQLDQAGVTLVEEERIVPLLAGSNEVDFSWADTPVDRDSIVFRVVPESDEQRRIEVLAVSYPPGENALVWRLSTDRAGPARVRISYLMGRLERQFSYRAVADPEERQIELSRHVRITNLSGEAFGESELWLGDGQRLRRPIELNETREVLVERIAGVPLRKTYNVDPGAIGYLDPAQDKLRVAMRYVIDNAGGTLGHMALPPGKVRIFQNDGQGGSAFLGEDWGEYTAPGASMELDIGVARDVTVRRVIEHSNRERVDGDLQRHEVVLRYEIENFKTEAVTLALLERPGQVHAATLGAVQRDPQWQLGASTSFERAPDAEHTNAEQLVLHATVPGAEAGEAHKLVQRLHLVFHNEW